MLITDNKSEGLTEDNLYIFFTTNFANAKIKQVLNNAALGMVRTMARYKIKVFFAVCRNALTSIPPHNPYLPRNENAKKTRDALRKIIREHEHMLTEKVSILMDLDAKITANLANYERLKALHGKKNKIVDENYAQTQEYVAQFRSILKLYVDKTILALFKYYYP